MRCLAAEEEGNVRGFDRFASRLMPLLCHRQAKITAQLSHDGKGVSSYVEGNPSLSLISQSMHVSHQGMANGTNRTIA